MSSRKVLKNGKDGRNVYVLHCSPDVEPADPISKNGNQAKRVVSLPVEDDVDGPIPDVAKAMHALTLFMSIPRRVAVEVIESAQR